MSMERIEMHSRGNCPVCSAFISSSGHIEVTEILPCPECQSTLVVDRIEERNLILSEAPQIEEDWGE